MGKWRLTPAAGKLFSPPEVTAGLRKSRPVLTGAVEVTMLAAGTKELKLLRTS